MDTWRGRAQFGSADRLPSTTFEFYRDARSIFVTRDVRGAFAGSVSARAKLGIEERGHGYLPLITIAASRFVSV